MLKQDFVSFRVAQGNVAFGESSGMAVSKEREGAGGGNFRGVLCKMIECPQSSWLHGGLF